MKVGDLVKVRRMSGLMTPLFGTIVKINEFEDYRYRVAIVKPFSGPIQPAHPRDVEVVSASR